MTREYRDVERQCKERSCKKPFILSAGEQAFFDRNAIRSDGKRIEIDPNRTDSELERMGLKRMILPARCPQCREKGRMGKHDQGRSGSPFDVLRGKEFPPRYEGKRVK